MGIEAGALAAYAAIAGSAVTAYTALTAKKPAAPAVQPITQADKPPQATKTPDLTAIAAKNAAAAGAGGTLSGNSSTFLTGPGGVDPTTLSLGKNTLLGQ